MSAHAAQCAREEYAVLTDRILVAADEQLAVAEIVYVDGIAGVGMPFDAVDVT